MKDKKTKEPTYMVLQRGGPILIPLGEEPKIAYQRITEHEMKKTASDYEVKLEIENMKNDLEKKYKKKIASLKGQVTKYRNKLKNKKS